MRTLARPRPFATSILVVVCFLAGGCTSSYEMKVDSISAPQPKGNTSYQMKTKVSAEDADSLRAQEAEIFVKSALSGKGLYEAPDPDRADMIVEVVYGVEAPRVRLERSTIPVYAQVGGGIRYEERPVIDAKGNANLRTVPVYDPPQTEMVGYQEIVTPVQIYEKYLRISAHENKPVAEGKAPPEIWSVNVKSEDESKDLRKYLPLLASASADYIGKETNVEKTIKVKETDSGVAMVRKGM
jgi:hypothetical protein